MAVLLTLATYRQLYRKFSKPYLVNRVGDCGQGTLIGLPGKLGGP